MYQFYSLLFDPSRAKKYDLPHTNPYTTDADFVQDGDCCNVNVLCQYIYYFSRTIWTVFCKLLINSTFSSLTATCTPQSPCSVVEEEEVGLNTETIKLHYL